MWVKFYFGGLYELSGRLHEVMTMTIWHKHNLK